MAASSMSRTSRCPRAVSWTRSPMSRNSALPSHIAHMAMHDPLTDLPNRVLFRQRLEAALHRVGARRTLRCSVS